MWAVLHLITGGERYNTFVLAMPDGSTAYHDKDQPTMGELLLLGRP